MKKIACCVAIVFVGSIARDSACEQSYEYYNYIKKLVAQLQCDTVPTNKYKQKKLVRLNRVLVRMDRKAHSSIHSHKHEKKFAYLSVLLAQQQEDAMLKHYQRWDCDGYAKRRYPGEVIYERLCSIS